MAIAESIYDFFEIAALQDSATFLDFVYLLIQVGVSVWIVIFIVKCLFMATTIGDRRFF